MKTNRAGTVIFSEDIEIANTKDEGGTNVNRCMVRNGKVFIVDKNDKILTQYNVPYGSNVLVNQDEKVPAGKVLFQWDPYTDVILARQTGIISLKDFIEGDTYQVESVESGKKQMVIIEAKDRSLSPRVEIIDTKGDILAGGTILPVTATLVVRKDQKVSRGQTLVKIPRDIGKTRDITGGLPRVAELFEARNPKNPSVVSEIDGIVKFGDTKRGVRTMIVEADDGESKKYRIPYGKHVIVHEHDRILAGSQLCEGSTSPMDILKILGAGKAREYLVNEIQEVYRLQGVKINDKHIEVIVRQMMQKISVVESGDTDYLPQDRINRSEFYSTNNNLLSKVKITDPGDSEFEKDMLVDKKEFIELNKELKESGKKPAKYSKTKPATFEALLMGITRASLNTESFISAASFQETTRVLTNAATAGQTDYLRGLKENVAVGRLIPAGTGLHEYRDIVVGNASEEQDDAESIQKAVS
jgi:DNA-directed RNA polymerase subunit beta'